MKTIQEMAREAHVIPYIVGPSNDEYISRIEAFAKLVREDERNRSQRENAYVLAEREACLDLAKNFAHNNTDLHDAICARSNT